jgi:hypothetical protein
MGLIGGGLGSFLGSELGSVGGRMLGGGKTGSRIGKGVGKILGGAAGALLPFKKGGKVPGKKNAPKPIMAHGGETVLPVGVKPTKAQKAAIRKRGGKI